MNRLQRLYKWLYQETSEWKPGYWGNVPYLLVLRSLVAFGIWLRFQLHADHPLPFWAALALLGAITLAVWLHLHPRQAYSRSIYGLLLLVDVVLISAVYWQTHRIESDFFLFYYLPIFTAAEYLSARWVVIAFFGSTLAFACVIFGMPAEVALQGATGLQVLLRVFLAREVFYIAISLVWALRLRRERDSRQRAIVRQRQMRQILDCKQEIDQTFAIDEALRVVVQHAAKDLEAPSVVCFVQVPDKDGTKRRIVKWSGDGPEPGAEALSACEAALSGHDQPGAASIVVLGGWIGALAASGLNSRELANSDEYLRSLTELAAVAYDRARLFKALREIGAAATLAVELNQKLESMLDYLVDDLEFEYAIISLVDNYQDRIRTVRGRNVPPGWIALSDHELSGGDILADVVKTGKFEVLEEYDHRFDYHIWNRYNHQRFARVFVPIVSADGGQPVVGTIEAGCSKERRKTVLDPHVEAVIELGRKSGELIARSVPSVLLELIAARTLELIGADSASLHVFKGDKEFLVAGAGRADKAFLRTYAPRANGIGRKAMASGSRIVENQIQASNGGLYATGVRSMAAFPLILTGDVRGVLYVHYWRDHTFSEAQLELVNVFVPEMEVAIQNSLLLQDFSKIDEKAWMVTGLQNVMASLGSNLDVDHLLQHLAVDAVYMLDAKNVTLYEYRQEERSFSKAVTGGRFEAPGEMSMQVHRDDIVAKVVAKGQSLFISDTAKDEFLSAPRTDNIPRPRFVVREGIKSCAILVLKSPYDDEIVGCLFVNYDEFQDFESVEKKGKVSLAHSMASAAAIAIKTARLHARDIGRNQLHISHRERELEAYREVDRAIVASAENLDIHAVCDRILEQTLRVLGPNGDVTLGDVTLWSEMQQRLELVAVRGYAEERVTASLKSEMGVVCWVAREKKSALVPDVNKDDRYFKIAEAGSELAVPILDVADGESRVLGVINVEHPSVNAFSERDQAFVETLAVQAAIAIHTVQLSRKLQRQVKQALALGTVGKRIQKGGMQLDALQRLILTGLTASDGLGFSRAMLFMVDEKAPELQGFCGIGALSKQLAEGNWSGIEHVDLETLLDWSERLTSNPVNSEFNETVRGIRIPFESLKGELHECLNAQSAQVFHLHAIELRETPLERLYQEGDHCALACVPLRSDERTVGIMLVDNRFLYHERNVDESRDPMLIAFADLAAMSIEGTRLRERLADESQLANWREASSRVAHVLNSHIINIRNLALDAAASLREHDVSQAQLQLDKVQRYHNEMTIWFKRIKSFSAPQTIVLSTLDLAEILWYTIESTKRNLLCEIEWSFPDDPVYVQGDALRMKTIFDELLYNAGRAMHKAETPDPRIRVALSVDAIEGMAVVVVEDNGPGIPPEILENLFEPYVTNSASTGLGLAIAKQFVEQHMGFITCSNGKQVGARFTIRFHVTAKEAAAGV